jgi:hypothetical protein
MLGLLTMSLAEPVSTSFESSPESFDAQLGKGESKHGNWTEVQVAAGSVLKGGKMSQLEKIFQERQPPMLVNEIRLADLWTGDGLGDDFNGPGLSHDAGDSSEEDEDQEEETEFMEEVEQWSSATDMDAEVAVLRRLVVRGQRTELLAAAESERQKRAEAKARAKAEAKAAAGEGEGGGGGGGEGEGGGSERAKARRRATVQRVGKIRCRL